MQRSKCKISNSEISRIPDFSSQFFTTYCIRLNCLSVILQKHILKRYGSLANIKKLADIEPNEKCILIGTLYKEMENKPSVLKELTESHQLGVRSIPPHKLISNSDLLYLEDHEQRIQLDRNYIKCNSFVSGIVVAIFGYESETAKGKFIIEDIIYACPEYPANLSPNFDMLTTNAKYIAIISGLQLNDNDDNNVVLVKLFFDWLCGLLPLANISLDAKLIGRLIIAGNSLADSQRNRNNDKMDPNDKLSSKKSDIKSYNNVSLLDQLINGVCQSIPVDILPGPFDPSSMSLPQKSMHRAIFPLSRRFTSFNTRPNPWTFYLDNGAVAIGTTGQTIDDIDRYSDINDPLDRLAETIKWGHMAPTAPDTLASYPNSSNVDPLIMSYKPSLYFAGNQDKLSWRHLQDDNHFSSLLLTVPRFAECGEIALVDMANYECHSLKFQ